MRSRTSSGEATIDAAAATRERVSQRQPPGATAYSRGDVEYGAPQVSDRERPFRSRIRSLLGKRTEELERLAVEMYARGLSVRDIEAAFTDETGRSLLSGARR